MRENFHLKIRTEYRQKEFAKRRFVKLAPTCQFFKQAVLENPVQNILGLLENLDYLQFLSYLSSVEDQQCNQHLVSEGVLDTTFEMAERVILNYNHTSLEDAQLNFLISILGNLIDFITLPNSKFSLIIKEGIEISKQSSKQLLLTLTWIIDEYQKKLILKDEQLQMFYQYLFHNLIHRDIASQLLDTLLNLQFRQKIVFTKDDIIDLMQCLNYNDSTINYKCCFVLTNMAEQSPITLPEEILSQLSDLLLNNDYLPLMKLCNIYYPKILLETPILLSRLEMCANEQKLIEYSQLIQKLINDNILSSDSFLKTLSSIDMTNQSEENRKLIESLIISYQD